MKKTQTLLLSITMVASLFGTAGLTTAAVIFDNGVPNGAAAAHSDNDASGNPGVAVQAAEDFSLVPGSTTIRDVHWFGTYAFGNTPSATDNFTLIIYDDNAGIPGNLLHEINVGNVGKVPTGGTICCPAFTAFSYSATISPITLNSGTTYWLSILNSTPTDTDDNWFWAESDSPGNAVQRFLAGPGPWFRAGLDPVSGVELAFNLTDDVTGQIVPEPGTLLLLGGGMVGLAWRRLRKR